MFPDDDSTFGGESVPGAMDPGPQVYAPSPPEAEDPSKEGGDTPPGEMDPGPQPAPDEDQTPDADDPSKDGSGGA